MISYAENLHDRYSLSIQKLILAQMVPCQLKLQNHSMISFTIISASFRYPLSNLSGVTYISVGKTADLILYSIYPNSVCGSGWWLVH